MDIKSIITRIVEKKLQKDSDDPCWDGYVQLGMKKKDGKEVPNCVPKESVELDESWSDGVSSKNSHMHAKSAAQYRKKANDSANMAKSHEKGSQEYNKHMAVYHSSMAKSIKSSYHAGDYGSVSTAKKDYKTEMDKAKEYKTMKESTYLDEAKFKVGNRVMDKKGNGEFIVTEVIPNITKNKPAAYRLARPTGSQSPNVWPESRLKLVKESVELDEAKTDVYHKHMLKALGKTRLPKNHSYTSMIADNGDFIVRDGSGRVVGRIPKAEHDLKEEVEKIDEISDRTKASYLVKAKSDQKTAQKRYSKAAYRDGGANFFDADTPEMERDLKRIAKRREGIAMAKEETDLTEEVHNDLNDVIIEFQRKLNRIVNKRPRDSKKFELDNEIRKEIQKIDRDLDDLRTGPLFKIRPGR